MCKTDIINYEWGDLSSPLFRIIYGHTLDTQFDFMSDNIMKNQRTKRHESPINTSIYGHTQKHRKTLKNGTLDVGKDEVTGSIPVSSSIQEIP